MDTPEEQLKRLFSDQIEIRPRSLTGKIESTVRDHPTYWETRLRLTAEKWDVYDKVLFNPENKEGYVIFACLKEEGYDKRVSTEIHTKVNYLVLYFKYKGPSRLGFMVVAFDRPYLAKASPHLKIKRPEAVVESETQEGLTLG